jgi:L-rhamnose mutarotase
MSIWRRANRLIMLIEAGAGFTPDQLVTGPDAHPRVKEWETLMTRFQRALPNADKTQWQPMCCVFNLSAQFQQE